ncbi:MULTISPECIES: UDP-N-acetylglucosamine--LPS N-acetylglucosamine transferase [Micromonospora]|uniref:UDP-N-acetylglucosamine--LPS N-acetylglucosamine transferase n=1 Tax=Micromonospora maris TaxID=1003110 RepID=A0A9X0I8Q9_9ACTN|nr:UDP-N-acetylglucosamine:LPS N-acetylglucosamine transferase-like protein [Micromonospora maris AB-18-032]KUJ49090.1 UDP-N-acetylglucosamine--LPS N-acetylglucosamine transferase [Micromonospora maris]RUL92055.1 UDP-N-acetylglucosamine--LPS N-acetylglucosamine transferase [Verrucosispora sp. FIM060022]
MVDDWTEVTLGRTGGASNAPDGRIVVVSADIGAGHDAAAAELERRLTDQGRQVDRLNFLSLLPGPLDVTVRESYRGMLRWLPWCYDALFSATGRSPASVQLLRAALRPVFRRMLARLPPDTRAVVTTFPFANQILGPMRVAGLVNAPLVTYVTDFAVHPTWIAPGVDLYCVVHELSRQQAIAGGSAPVRVVRPLVNARFAASAQLSTQAARRQFGLPEQGRLALIVAGSWGMGDVARTATEVLATGCVEPVVVCGRNQRLYRRLRRFPGHVLGWVDDMPTLMRAADVVVENAGGLTCQEALASGRPTITYRPIAGHGRANADLLSRSALTSYIDSAQRLRPALTELLAAAEGGDPGADARIDMAGVVADVLTPMR